MTARFTSGALATIQNYPAFPGFEGWNGRLARVLHVYAQWESACGPATLYTVMLQNGDTVVIADDDLVPFAPSLPADFAQTCSWDACAWRPNLDTGAQWRRLVELRAKL